MNLKTAQAIFNTLEAYRYESMVEAGTIGTEPIFDARLDAGTGREDARTYRVRVTLGAIQHVAAETWQMVVDLAASHGLSVALQNNGMELYS